MTATTRAPIWFQPSYLAASDALEAVVGKAFQKRTSKHDSAKVERQVNALVCNCLAAALWGDGSFFIRMDKSDQRYKPANPYRHPDVEKGTLPNVVGEWTGYECLALVQPGSNATGMVSRYGPQGWLKDALEGLGPSDIALDHRGPVLYVREKEERDWWRPTDDREVTNKWFDLGEDDNRARAEELHSLNEWFETFDLRVDGAHPAEVQRRYYRLFLATVSEHGRLYGHSIVNWDSDARWQFSIDREQLVEIDVTASLATIAYARQSQYVLPARPYEIEAVVEGYERCGFAPEDAARWARKCVKAVVTRRLCDKGPRDRYWQDKPGEEPFPWPRGTFSCPELIAKVCEHLPALGPFIKADRDQPPEGLELMRAEADIILLALAMLRGQVDYKTRTRVTEPIKALPVHDALYVKHSQYRLAAECLSRAFHEKTGVWPILTCTNLFTPDETEIMAMLGQSPVIEDYRERGKRGRGPSWSPDPKDWLLSYRNEHYRLRRGTEQQLARRLDLAWEMHTDNSLRTHDGPPTMLDRIMHATAVVYRLMQDRGCSQTSIDAAIHNSLRAWVDWGLPGTMLAGVHESLTAAGVPPDKHHMTERGHQSPRSNDIVSNPRRPPEGKAI